MYTEVGHTDITISFSKENEDSVNITNSSNNSNNNITLVTTAQDKIFSLTEN